MNPTILAILILGLVGTLGIIAHALKATDDRNKALTDSEYTFGMYWKKNKYAMYFVFICIWVFSYYQSEWAEFEKLGNWRGLIMFAGGYMGDSVFPSLLGLVSTITDKVKSAIGGKNDAGNP